MRVPQKERIINKMKHLLFDKYEIIRPLGTGSFSTVYLVRHISLDQERAIKIIPHDQVLSASELTEAQLLKSLSHPGIPQIFDIEEDESNFYIVEEYIVGDSLEHILLHQQIISLDFYIRICEQLCDIFKYLHSFRPLPILYRDLKPEHIILCGNQIKLIDFNISLYVSNQGNKFKFYGNLNYSAPECFTEEQVSLKADLYSLGKILYELYEHVDTSFSQKIQKILKKSIESDPSLRYETVEDFESELLQELSKSVGPHLVKKIAVVGSNHGCGSTHIAISLVCSLNYSGYCATYHEKNLFSDLQKSAQYLKGSYEEQGYIYYKFFKGLPSYGPGIIVSDTDDGISVFDYGTDFSDNELENTDIVLFVCGGAIWHRNAITDIYNSLLKTGIPFYTICNLCDRKSSIALSKLLHTQVLNYPFDTTPFIVSKDKTALFKQLLDKNGGSLSFLESVKHNIFHRK